MSCAANRSCQASLTPPSTTLEMAASATLKICEQRAFQAEEILSMLKRQLQLITSHTAKSTSTAEVSDEVIRLQDENSCLTKEVETLKQRLTYLELLSGKKRIKLPTNSEVIAAGSTVKCKNVQPPETVPTPSQPTTQPDHKGKTENKEKKQKKASSETKAKAKKSTEPAKQADDNTSKPIDISRLNMKIGHIVSVKKHPDADSLYVEEVNVGEDRPRTIVSGLVRHIPIEKMKDRLAIFCCNLKPAKMRGILSEGMIMCASSPEKVEIIDPPEGCVPGDRVTVAEYPGEPDALLNPKKKIFEQIQPDLRTDDECIATYKGCKWIVKDKGICRAPTMSGFNIK